MIEESRISLTVASVLCPHLDKQSDVATFLQRFAGKTKREAEFLLVDTMSPRPSPKDDVRRVADREIPRQNLPSDPKPGEPESNCPPSASPNIGLPEPAPKPASPKPNIVREKCYQITFAASERLKVKLDQLKDRLAHKYPDARLEHIIEEAVDGLLAAKTPKAKRPMRAAPSNSRYLPVAIEEALEICSQDQCEFVGKGGRRCTETRFLQVDHITPLSLGGKTELKNLQKLCAKHNQYKARLDHGDFFVDEKIGQHQRTS